MYFSKNLSIDYILGTIKPQVKAMLNICLSGIDIEVKEHRNKRTSAQNNFYWLNVSDIADVLNDGGCSYGEFNLPYTSELIHDINKIVFGVKTTTRMTIKEFCQYMDKMTVFWIEKTNGAFQPKEVAFSYLERTGLIEKRKKK